MSDRVEKHGPMAASEWRLIVDEAAGGAWNMAVDRAIQSARESGQAPPTLRLYAWSGPTLTIGRFQDLDGIDLDACRREGVAVVRRGTGGRGVLHDDEVTYSVVASTSDGLPRGTTASYRHLGMGVVETYRNLGVDADVSTRSRGSSATSACYLQTTQADVSAGSTKLSGSAQVWQGATCLQHGSFARTRDLQRERAVFRLSARDAAALAARTVTLEDLCGEPPERERIIQAAVEGFARGLGIRLVTGDLSDQERRFACELQEEAENADPGPLCQTLDIDSR
jgi:lipoate-protein ligase A